MDDLPGGAHDRIRVGLGGMPALVMEMLRRSLVDAGIDVVTLAESAAGWADCATVDVVIVPTDAAGIQARSCDLLRSRSRMKMLTLSTETDHADLFELRLVGTNVGLQGVVAAVRSVAHVVH